MQNKPNFQKSQMLITTIKTRSYNEKCKLDTWSKQTQSKPIQTQMPLGMAYATKPILLSFTAGKIALSFAEWGSRGNHQNNYPYFYAAGKKRVRRIFCSPCKTWPLTPLPCSFFQRSRPSLRRHQPALISPGPVQQDHNGVQR